MRHGNARLEYPPRTPSGTCGFRSWGCPRGPPAHGDAHCGRPWKAEGRLRARTLIQQDHLRVYPGHDSDHVPLHLQNGLCGVYFYLFIYYFVTN